MAWEEGEVVKYQGFILDKDGRPSVCPRCSNEELNGEYCKICGTYIVNKCSAETDLDLNGNEYVTKESCGAPAEGNARYCIHCGNRTTYYINGLLPSWNEEKI